MSGEGALAGLPDTPPPPQAFNKDGSAAWRTKSSREKQCRAEIQNMCYQLKMYNLSTKLKG